MASHKHSPEASEAVAGVAVADLAESGADKVQHSSSRLINSSPDIGNGFQPITTLAWVRRKDMVDGEDLVIDLNGNRYGNTGDKGSDVVLKWHVERLLPGNVARDADTLWIQDDRGFQLYLDSRGNVHS